MRRLALSLGALAVFAGACGSADETVPAVGAEAERNAEPTVDESSNGPGTDDDAGTITRSDASGDDVNDEPTEPTAAASDSGSVTDSLTAALLSNSYAPVRNEDEARCVSEQIVHDIGEARLTDLGVTADHTGAMEDIDFSDDEILTLLGTVYDCVDVQALLADQLATTFGAESAECIADSLDEDMVTSMLALALEGGFGTELPEDFLDTFLAIMNECGVDLGA